MKRILLLAFVAAGFSSCADEESRKPVGPTTETSRIPWNTPIAGQGGGQLSALPQNQYRR